MAAVQYVICLGSFLSNLSAGMFNIALVDIAGDYHRSLASAQWIVTVYLLTISVCLPLMGGIGDMRGKRSVHNLGYFVFMLGSLLCALAPNLSVLIGFRVLQGVGASMYQANNMALVVSLFPPERRGRALGTVSTFVAAGALIGPSLGGVILQWASWRLNFWLLAGAALGAWLLAQRLIPRDRPVGGGKPDGRGAVMFAAALTGLVVGLNLGPTRGWSSAAVWVPLLAFAVFAALFVRWSLSPRWARTGRSPFVRLAMFNHPAIAFGILLTVVTYAAAFAVQLALPVFLQGAMGIVPAAAGLIVMSYPASLIVSAPISGGSSDKYGSTPVMLLGLGCMAAALAALGLLRVGRGLAYVVSSVVLLGCAMGMITSPNNSIIMNRTPTHGLGMMSSMIALHRNIGMMTGAIVGGMMTAAGEGGTGGSGSAAELARGFRGGALWLAAAVIAALFGFLWVMRLGVRRERAEARASAGAERGSAM